MHLVNKIQTSLVIWRWKHMFMGGRIVMIKVVLSNIPIYPCSFYRIPKHIVNEIIKIQHTVLWGGSESQKKFCWDNICRSKK